MHSLQHGARARWRCRMAMAQWQHLRSHVLGPAISRWCSTSGKSVTFRPQSVGVFCTSWRRVARFHDFSLRFVHEDLASSCTNAVRFASIDAAERQEVQNTHERATQRSVERVLQHRPKYSSTSSEAAVASTQSSTLMPQERSPTTTARSLRSSTTTACTVRMNRAPAHSPC